ncbi:hypothetical protein FHS96_004961 [Sphingomonas zeicaulis]
MIVNEFENARSPSTKPPRVAPSASTTPQPLAEGAPFWLPLGIFGGPLAWVAIAIAVRPLLP